MEARGLLKLGRFSGEDLGIYLWWSSLAAKFVDSGIMDVVSDMSTYAKMTMGPKTFGPRYFFLSIS